MVPEGPQKKPVLAREREARLKGEPCRYMFSNAASHVAIRGNKAGKEVPSSPVVFVRALRRGLDHVAGHGSRGVKRG